MSTPSTGIIKRVRELRDAIRYHEERYYIHNDPEISDDRVRPNCFRSSSSSSRSIRTW